MGLDEELLRRQNQRLAAATKPVVPETESRRAVLMLQDALAEFLGALTKYQVPQHTVVEMRLESTPARVKRSIFGEKYEPATTRFHARPIAACWVFHSLLLFEDGKIAKAPRGWTWGVGKLQSWKPDDIGHHVDPTVIGRVVGDALADAGLRSTRQDHLYVGSGFTFEFISWERDLAFTKAPGRDSLGITLDNTRFGLEGDTLRVVWDGYEGLESASLPEAFADYIEAKGRPRGPAVEHFRSNSPR